MNKMTIILYIIILDTLIQIAQDVYFSKFGIFKASCSAIWRTARQLAGQSPSVSYIGN